MTRDELHSETSALRIDDPDQTSRHSSSQYANSAFALRGAETIFLLNIVKFIYYTMDILYIYIYMRVYIFCVYLHFQSFL